jgi:hypothetical protein
VKSGLGVTGSEQLRRVLAVGDDEIVFYGSQKIHFEVLRDDHLRQVAVVSRRVQGVVPALTERNTISMLAQNGDLIVANRTTGDFMVVDRQRKTNLIVNMAEPQPILAAVSDSAYIYLLCKRRKTVGRATVLKVDLRGHVCAAYQCSVAHRCDVPTLLGLKGRALYLADSMGRGNRFSMP